ncbi:hypothetical protein [Variovorax terrae]|uniref:SnoaL-like domain-containing protein n=1 Tax=Variovorax terrae TaxID=2923278 RepID=A0A9X1VX85_9BURK|nr:hypothetical protein [Variovorax terrae]MCJ0764923.1 hypothetical protein [Variovorax terrae]
MSKNPLLQNDPVIRVSITELIDDFFGRVDRGESVADLLAEQAIFKTPQRYAEGRQGVANLLLELAQMRREKGREARHFGSNIKIDSLGDNQYRVRSLVVVIALDSGAARKGVLNMGDHDDIVAFDESGRCHFVKRTMTPVLQLELNAPAAQ